MPDDCQMLHADRPWLSASLGAMQLLELHAGIAHANRPFVVSGSAKGTRPGSLSAGVLVPGSVFRGTYGMLDAEGRAKAAIELEPGHLDLAVVGKRFHHSYVVLNGGAVVATSNATTLEIRP